jgi:hypothetical protein
LAFFMVNYPLPKINSHVINETQILQMKCSNIYKLNYPAKQG